MSSSSSSLSRHSQAHPPILPNNRKYTQAFSDDNNDFIHQHQHPSTSHNQQLHPDSAQMAAYSITQLANQSQQAQQNHPSDGYWPQFHQQQPQQLPQHQPQPQQQQQSFVPDTVEDHSPPNKRPRVKDEKRASQNREAQRTFRQKRDNYIKDLEAQSKELTSIKRLSGLETDPSKFGTYYHQLVEQVKDLKKENNLLKDHVLKHLGQLPDGVGPIEEEGDQDEEDGEDDDGNGSEGSKGKRKAKGK